MKTEYLIAKRGERDNGSNVTIEWNPGTNVCV